MAAGLGLGVTDWSPLERGVLTGKQLEAGGAKDYRQSYPGMKQFMASDARKEAIVREVVALARECGHSPAQVALARSEEHTSELQSHLNLVCRLLLEKKKSYSEVHPSHVTH